MAVKCANIRLARHIPFSEKQATLLTISNVQILQEPLRFVLAAGTGTLFLVSLIVLRIYLVGDTSSFMSKAFRYLSYYADYAVFTYHYKALLKANHAMNSILATQVLETLISI